MPKTTLDAILRATRQRIAGLRGEARQLARRAAAAPEPRPFARALAGPAVGVIAEVKRRSPSAGAIREDLDPVAHAVAYERGGARAISVLTDELHFGGSLDDLARVAQAVGLPVIRKDFILDELQLFEARAAGASAVLLIVRALAPEALAALARAAASLGLAVAVGPAALGVNSRDPGRSPSISRSPSATWRASPAACPSSRRVASRPAAMSSVWRRRVRISCSSAPRWRGRAIRRRRWRR